MLEWIEAHQLPCLFRTYFGIRCPGCGFQTALIWLLKGDLKASFMAYPPLIPVLFFMVVAALKIGGVKKIRTLWIKNLGFACLSIILISYLFSLTNIFIV